jgi:translation elongation factor EF-1alpha
MSFEKEGEIVVFVENKEDIPNISKNKYEQIVNFITQILQNSGYAVKTKKEMFSGGIKVQGRKNINVNGKTAGTLITYELKLYSDKLSLKHTAGV